MIVNPKYKNSMNGHESVEMKLDTLIHLLTLILYKKNVSAIHQN